jgi:feruloyl esterase
MRHCSSDGDGGDTIDMLSALEQWVEQGRAPGTLVGYNFDWTGMTLKAPTWPLDPSRVRFARPVYPYPAFAVYKGQGDGKRDPKLADSFRPSR